MDDWAYKSGRLGVILPKLAADPPVSIVIPCYQEEEHIEAVVRAAANQQYPADRIEIFVVDGGSYDRTCDIVEKLAAEDSRISLLHNPARLQSAAMNLAIVRSRGDVIVRMDAHAEYDSKYVASAVAALRRTGALNVGGAVRLRAKTAFQRALCIVLESPLGVGGSGAWDPAREGFVESVWGGVFRREAFELVGLYDPSARTNEDAELCQRIIEGGGRIYQSRDIINYYYPRKSLGALFRQYLGYGIGRARTFCRHGKLLSPRPMVPFLALSTFVLLVFASFLDPRSIHYLLGAVALYVATILLESIRLSTRSDSWQFLRIAVIFPVMHLAHGLGFAAGLVMFAGRAAREEEPERLAVR